MVTFDDLQQQFPDMRPVKHAPWLGTINGIGMMMYGRREPDMNTGTYIKTWCLCFIYLPLLALGAYRVADAEDGWYFIGKEPVSVLGKMWNMVVIAALVGGTGFGAWSYHTNTPTYLARQKIAEADRLVEAGQLDNAARMYSSVSVGKMPYAVEARDKLHALIKTKIENAPPDQAVGVIDAVIDYYGPDTTKLMFPDLKGRVLSLVQKHRADNPRGALDLMDSIRDVYEPTEEIVALRETLLVGIVANDPNDMESASELALIYESRGEDQKCVDLLGPLEDQLGDSQGARVLGQIYAARGEIEPAYKLLKPYTSNRLDQLRSAEQDYELAINAAWDRQIKLLNEGAAPDSFYTRYEQADEAKQDAIVETYVQDRIKDDRAINRALDQLGESSQVVPVALDLGIVMLGRASTMSDPDAKRVELEDAEQTFLAIRGLAGESDEYRMYLGQIYYWLGKADQGRALFDELMATHERSSEVLFAVTSALREVGAVSDARLLAEEAYKNAKKSEDRYNAARLRSVMQRDLNDEIDWLRKANPDDVHTQAALNAALGSRAANHGKHEEARSYLQLAIGGYESLPTSTGSLNNAALAYLSLFDVDGDPATLKKAISLMDQAVALEPSNSILILNTAQTHVQSAVYDMIKDRIDAVALGVVPSLEVLPYLYDSTVQRSGVAAELAGHPSILKALAYSDRLMLVSPQRPNSYATPLTIHSYNLDLDKLIQLKEQIDSVQIDLSDTLIERRAYYAGQRDDKFRRENKARIEKWRDTVNKPAVQDDPLMFAYAAGVYIDLCISGSEVGIEADSDELVGLAERALANLPANGTRSNLRSALYYRAIHDMIDTDPAFARFISHTKRSLGFGQLIALAMNAPQSFTAAVADHPDVIRAAESIEANGPRYDNHWSPQDWAILRVVRPGLADTIASSIMADETARITRQLTRSLNGESHSQIVVELWEAQISGDPVAVRAALKRADEAGLSLPSASP